MPPIYGTSRGGSGDRSFVDLICALTASVDDCELLPSPQTPSNRLCSLAMQVIHHDAARPRPFYTPPIRQHVPFTLQTHPSIVLYFSQSSLTKDPISTDQIPLVLRSTDCVLSKRLTYVAAYVVAPLHTSKDVSQSSTS